VGAQTEDKCRQSELPYGDAVRNVQVDMIAFDGADQTIRPMKLSAATDSLTPAKYAPSAVAAESRIIFYYGIRSILRPWWLVKDELDNHFGLPAVARIEQANDYFRTKLHALLEAPA